MEAFAGARLVTLTGPGGAGKTRLAAEAAARLLERIPDGVWLAELASVADPVDLPQAVLSLFGAREQRLLAAPGATAVAPLDRLVEAIGGRRVLLVADNCEHLVEAVAKLVDHLLARCPRLSVLATSREPLGIAGELLHPVGPLAVPDGDVSPAEALAYPAVRPLADRGRAARVQRRPGDAGAGAGICRALDGMPLAIELAAARFHALSPEQVAARLDDRFRLLADGRRSMLGRHQTLRAVIDWSWELLGGAEQVLLRRLAVFAGGATLEAAERVCAGPGLAGPAPRRGARPLAGLVDVAGGGGRARRRRVRYRMLRRSGPMGPSGWRRPARTRPWPGPTPATSWSWPRRPSPSCAAGTSCAGWPGWPPSATTCTRPCAGPSTAGRRPRPCGWPPPSAGSGS
jgi:predicted ATPase